MKRGEKGINGVKQEYTGSEEAIRTHTVSYGIIWGHTGSFGVIRGHKVSYGVILGPSGSFGVIHCKKFNFFEEIRIFYIKDESHIEERHVSYSFFEDDSHKQMRLISS